MKVELVAQTAYEAYRVLARARGSLGLLPWKDETSSDKEAFMTAVRDYVVEGERKPEALAKPAVYMRVEEINTFKAIVHALTMKQY